jgi:hypothetical protein
VKPERPPLPLLIAQLARDGTPVTPLPSPFVRWCMWTLVAVVAAAIVASLIGLRPALALYLRNSRFLIAAIVTGAVALTAAGGAFVLSVPGASRDRVARAVPLLAIVAWGVLLWTRLREIGDPVAQIVATPWHPVCVALILSISALPGIWLFGMLRRAAPLHTMWTGMLAALATVALGALGTQFVCPIDAPAHQLVWHFTPVVVLTLPGIVLGARIFTWRRHSAGTFRRLPWFSS